MKKIDYIEIVNDPEAELKIKNAFLAGVDWHRRRWVGENILNFHHNESLIELIDKEAVDIAEQRARSAINPHLYPYFEVRNPFKV
jgi:hypothetical protein